METIEEYMDIFFNSKAILALENVIISLVNYGTNNLNIYLFIILVTLLVMPAYMGMNAFTRVAWIRSTQNTISGKNILYVIAHPDDEAM